PPRPSPSGHVGGDGRTRLARPARPRGSVGGNPRPATEHAACGAGADYRRHNPTAPPRRLPNGESRLPNHRDRRELSDSAVNVRIVWLTLIALFDSPAGRPTASIRLTDSSDEWIQECQSAPDLLPGDSFRRRNSRECHAALVEPTLPHYACVSQ